MENGAITPMEQCSIFHNNCKYTIFQRRQKELLWGKGLIHLCKTCRIFSKNLLLHPPPPFPPPPPPPTNQIYSNNTNCF